LHPTPAIGILTNDGERRKTLLPTAWALLRLLEQRYHFRPSFQTVQIIRPSLHHLAPLRQVLGKVVSGTDGVAFDDVLTGNTLALTSLRPNNFLYALRQTERVLTDRPNPYPRLS
jgi:hypothetical protein